MRPEQDRRRGVDPERQQLESRIAELERRLDARDAQERSVPEPDGRRKDQRTDATHVTRKGFWTIPGTDIALKVGGYVKLDVIHDFYEIGNDSKFQSQTIAVPEQRQSRTNIHAKETRINLDARAPLGDHEARVFVEGDFFGDGTTFHLRHAFGQVGGLLAGQTWTTYMDLSSRPHTLDFEGPDAELFVRNPMVRWTQDIGEQSSLSIAVEDAAQDISFPTTVSGAAATPLPDLAANFRMEREDGHVQLSGVVRYLDFDGTNGSRSDEAVGWGVALSGLKELGDHGHRLMGQIAYGEGSAYYNQAMRGTGSDAVLNPRGELDAIPIFTAVAGYEQDWSETWSSTFAYSIANLDTKVYQSGSVIDMTQTASANLTWHPWERFMTGVEYLFGIRENRDGSDGFDHRLQFSFKFWF